MEKKEKKYRRRVKTSRGRNAYVVPFHTRCSPNKFIEVCNNLKTRVDRMGRLKKIGFEKLVDICCHKMHRDYLGELMRIFDPHSKRISIRGKSLQIRPSDVKKLMGLPFGGLEIDLNVNISESTFKDFRSVYGKLPYKQIASWLMEDKEDPNFEFLFVLYALGTLLCPSASVHVSDRVLKVMVATEGSFEDYDWCSFVLNELCICVGDYKKRLLKGKASGKQNVGGCLYLLMIYCLQHFPFENQKADKVEDALVFWNENNVKRRLKLEKDSIQGLLYGVSNVASSSSRSFNPQLLTHPVIKRTYESLMSRVASMVGEELLDLQSRLFEGGEDDEEEGHGAHEGHEDDIIEISQSDDDDVEADEGDGRHEEDKDEDEDELKGQDQDDKDEDQSPSDNVRKEGEAEIELRKSTRIRKPAMGSPWVLMMGKVGKRKNVDEPESLFQLCTTRPNESEGQE